MDTPKRLLLFFVTLISGHALCATDVQLSGNFGYQVNGSQVTLTVNRVENVDNNTTSGTLQLSLWATSSPYNGGGINGYKLGEYQFNDVLQSGQYFFDVSQTVAYDAPPDGTYYLSMILAEWSGSAFEIIDSGAFSGTETFGSTTPTPTPTPSDPSGIPGSTSQGGDWYTNPIIGSFTPLGSGWSYSDWFGSFYYAGASWFYRPGFDWTYVSGSSTAASSWWVYVNNSNDWCWTNSSFYPSIFSTTANTWLWFDDNASDFWNANTGSYVGDSGSSTGGAFTVDYILTNTGGLSQASWNEFTQTYSDILSQSGYTDYYQYSSTNNQLVLRFDTDSSQAAAQLRSSLQSLVGDYGGFRIDVE